MLHQGVRVRDVATDPKWKPVSDPDMMLVHVIMPKAEEVGGAGRGGGGGADRRRPSPKSSRRARRTRTRTRRRTTRRSRQAGSQRRGQVKLDCRARQSRGRSTAARGTTSGSRWSTSWRGARSVAFEVGAGRGADGASGGRPRRACSAKPLTFMNLSGEAVGGLRGTSRSSRPTCWSSSTRCSCRWASCGCGRAGSAGGHNGLKSVIAAPRRRSSRGCGSASGAATIRGAISPITCWRGSTRDEARGGRAHDRRGRPMRRRCSSRRGSRR